MTGELDSPSISTHSGTQEVVELKGYLRDKEGTWYYRRRIPIKFLKYFRGREISKGLSIKVDGRANEALAQASAKLWDIRVDKVFYFLSLESMTFEQKMAIVTAELYPLAVKRERLIPIPPPIHQKRLREICDEHLKRHRVSKKWRPATDVDVVTACDRACEILDNPVLDEMTPAHIDYLIEILSKMPLNRTRSPRYRDKTLQQIFDDIEALPADKKPQTLGKRSIKKDLVWIKDVLSGVDKELLFKRAELPTIDAMTGSPRIPFELNEIQQLINLLCWKPKYPVRFWAPLIGICHGLRANEICQLRADEIFVLGGEPCIRITFEPDTGRNVKGNIIRVLPLHPFLAELGLVKYAQMIREAGHIQLFPQIKVRKKGSSYSHDYTNWSSRLKCGFVRKVTQDKRKTLHSFRHNFSTHLNSLSEVKGHFVSYLAGHANSENIDIDKKATTTLKIYTHSDDFKKLKEVLNQLYLDQLDWRSVKLEVNKIEGLDKVKIEPIKLEVPSNLKEIASGIADRWMKDFKD